MGQHWAQLWDSPEVTTYRGLCLQEGYLQEVTGINSPKDILPHGP